MSRFYVDGQAEPDANSTRWISKLPIPSKGQSCTLGKFGSAGRRDFVSRRDRVRGDAPLSTHTIRHYAPTWQISDHQKPSKTTASDELVMRVVAARRVSSSTINAVCYEVVNHCKAEDSTDGQPSLLSLMASRSLASLHKRRSQVMATRTYLTRPDRPTHSSRSSFGAFSTRSEIQRRAQLPLRRHRIDAGVAKADRPKLAA